MRSSISKKMQRIYKSLDSIANSNANILILGESGTGKELIAKQIHLQSSGAHNEFISINCAAIPEALLESELFGHKRGSFTGAYSDQMGMFERANGGTIFLDEIGDMPLALQAKMLRVIQERKIRPIGTTIEKPVNFKLISATHRNLKTEILNGRFREDLYFRLSVIPICLPPLRQRREDIPNLISKFSTQFSEKYGICNPKFSHEAIGNLCSRKWPGNIRELENLIEQVVVLRGDSEIVRIEDLPGTNDSNREEEMSRVFENLKRLPTVSEFSNEYINYVLNHVKFHQSEAAKILGVSRRTLYRKIKSEPTESLGPFGVYQKSIGGVLSHGSGGNQV